MRLVSIAVWTTKLGGVRERVALRWLTLCRRLADQAGQTLAEYAVLVSGIAVAVLLTTLLIFQDGITTAFSDATDCIQGRCVANLDTDDGDNDHCNDGRGQDGNHGSCID